MPTTNPATRRTVGIVLAVILILGAGSFGTIFVLLAADDDGSSSPDTTVPVTLPPESPRSECTDVTGDIEDVNEPAGTTALTDPAGIDLVDTVANRTDDAVEVSFTVAGDIEGTTTNPAFILFRGQQAATQGSFEVQALRADDGTWALYLVEYLTNLGERDKLDVPVTVDGDTLSFTVPLAALPPITGTLLWSFGTYDGDRASVAELDAPSTSTTVPSTDPPEATVGFSDFCTPYDDVADGATTTTAG